MALTATISEDLKAAPDAIFTAQALPNATVIDSAEFIFGEIQDALEVVINAVTAVSIANTFRLTIELLGASSSGGSFAVEAIIFDEISTGSTDFLAGEEIARIASHRALSPYSKIRLTTTADESTETIDAYMVQASR